MQDNFYDDFERESFLLVEENPSLTFRELFPQIGNLVASLMETFTPSVGKNPFKLREIFPSK
jgi:hypothetical protein